MIHNYPFTIEAEELSLKFSKRPSILFLRAGVKWESKGRAICNEALRNGKRATFAWGGKSL